MRRALRSARRASRAVPACHRPTCGARGFVQIGTLACCISVILSAMIVVPGLTRAGSPPASKSGTLVLRGTPTLFSGTFWAINGQTASAHAFDTDSNIGHFLNSSPIRFVQIGGGSDYCNASTDVLWTDSGTFSPGCNFNVGAFKAWCYSLAPHCSSEFVLPGENNNTGQDASIANYLVNTLGFSPTYWAIGNEPLGWKHFGIAWPNWRTSDSSAPTALAYAVEVRSQINAIRALPGLSSAKFIGVEAAEVGDGYTSVLHDVGSVDGALISGVSYHSYPHNSSTPNNSTYLGSLMNPTQNLSYTTSSARSALLGGCSGCSSLPIFTMEYNGGPAAPSNGAVPQDSEFVGAVFISASVVQALEWNTGLLSYFKLQSSDSTYGFALMNSTDSLSPVGVLYKKVLPYLAGADVDNVSVRVPGSNNFWSVMLHTVTSAGHTIYYRYSLLLVNANLTNTVSVSLGSVWPSALAGTIVSWATGAGSPTVSSVDSFASSYSVSPVSLLLLNGSKVTFTGGADNSTNSTGNLTASFSQGNTSLVSTTTSAAQVQSAPKRRGEDARRVLHPMNRLAAFD